VSMVMRRGDERAGAGELSPSSLSPGSGIVTITGLTVCVCLRCVRMSRSIGCRVELASVVTLHKRVETNTCNWLVNPQPLIVKPVESFQKPLPECVELVIHHAGNFELACAAECSIV